MTIRSEISLIIFKRNIENQYANLIAKTLDMAENKKSRLFRRNGITLWHTVSQRHDGISGTCADVMHTTSIVLSMDTLCRWHRATRTGNTQSVLSRFIQTLGVRYLRAAVCAGAYGI
jgi:hypothetical protein